MSFITNIYNYIDNTLQDKAASLSYKTYASIPELKPLRILPYGNEITIVICLLFSSFIGCQWLGLLLVTLLYFLPLILNLLSNTLYTYWLSVPSEVLRFITNSPLFIIAIIVIAVLCLKYIAYSFNSISVCNVEQQIKDSTKIDIKVPKIEIDQQQEQQLKSYEDKLH